MDLLVEVSAAAPPGLAAVGGAPPGQSTGGAFPELLSSLMAGPGAATLEARPEVDEIAAFAPSTEDAPAADPAATDGAGSADAALPAALVALLATLMPATAPVPVGPATGGESAALAGVGDTTAVATTASALLAPPADAEPGPADEPSPPGGTGAEPPQGTPAAVAPTPPLAGDAEQELSVVRIDGNAEVTETPVTAERTSSSAASPAGAAALAAGSLPRTESAASSAQTPVAGHVQPSAAEPALEQVVHAVFERVAEGGGDVRLRLDPPDLGEILIQVTVDGGAVSVDIHADNPEAARLLRDSTPNLSALLDDRGLGLADVSVGHEAPRQGGHQSGADPQPGARTRPGEFAGLLGLEPAATRSPYVQVRGVTNPDGAFDYRV